jgi:copper homeostasis protein
MGMILEVCVDTLAGLEAAFAGGADRIELCSALALGGLTPSAGFMRHAAGCGVPVLAMIRPRAGDFVWSEAELRVMEADIAAARAAGLAGVVLGASLQDGRLDVVALARLVGAARGLDLTLHRCFDLVPDMHSALEEAVALGFRRILTSGGEATAEAGAGRIAALIAQAAGRIAIMPGAGVSARNVRNFIALGAREVHGSCSVSIEVNGPAVALGFGAVVERRTDAATVRAVKRAMEAAG